jgi:signal peptidase I
MDFQNEVPETPEAPQPPARGRRIFAIFLSALVPGSGQLLLCDTLSGLICLGLFVILFLLVWPLRLLATYPGFIVIFLSGFALRSVSACLTSRTCANTSRPLSKWWFGGIIPIVFVMAALLLHLDLLISGFRAFSIPSTSMVSALMPGDTIIADMHAYKTKKATPGDIVLFHHHGIVLVKRLIATEGDSVSGKDRNIWVNGTEMTEPYVSHTGDATDAMNNFGPIKVPAGEVFVLGDNRDESLDSRLPEFGSVTNQDIAGKALYIVTSKQDRTGRRVQ